MKKLKRLVLVQYFLYEAIELDISGHVAFLGQNGSGKTSLLDAIQIAMLGAHGNYLAFNTQSVSVPGGGRRNPRSIRDYCLGVVDDTGSGGPTDRKRDESITYITLVFEDNQTREPVTIGTCLRATATAPTHDVLGLYVLNGISLGRADHLEMADEGEVPLLYDDFCARARARSAAAGRTPFFTEHPTKYIGEMIHALQPKAKSIDVREYLKVFNKSVLLRNIESVDTFVRDYVVEPQTIDRRKAKQQIDLFKELNDLLHQVEQQIIMLGVIGDAYGRVAHYRSREASIRALAADYDFLDSKSRADSLHSEILHASRNRRLYRIAAASHRRNVQQATKAWEEAVQALHSTPGADAAEAYAQQLLSNRNTFGLSLRRLEKDVSAVAGVVNEIATHKLLPTQQRRAKEIDRELAHQANRLEQELLTGLDATVGKALTFLRDEVEPLKQAVNQAATDIVEATGRLRAMIGMVNNADKDGAPISEAVGAVIEYLHQHGIEAEPVCNLVQVSDPRWQPAIEAFLGSNRESLVVANGREREAVRLIRGMSDRDDPFAAKVVQPHHLKGRTWNDADAKLVGNLLTSSHPVALAYLRALMGQMRCVETEEELEQYSRALTVDGMLSSNFTTSRLRLVPIDRLQMGKRMTYAEKEALRQRLQLQLEAETTAKERHASLQVVLDRIMRLGDLDDKAQRVAEEVRQALAEQQSILDVQNKINLLDTRQHEPLRQRVKESYGNMEAARSAENENQAKLTATESTLRTLFPQLQAARRDRNAKEGILKAALSIAGVDDDVMARVRSDIEGSLGDGGHQGRMTGCWNRIKIADRDAQDAFASALTQFQSYLDRHGIALGDELKDWRLALAWVRDEKQRLMDTELVGRRAEVEKARIAAEEAFRNDIAVRIRESIEQMKETIRRLNQILKACPPFSNGERYSFVVHPAEAHKAVHDYIINVGKSSEQDLFTLGDSGHEVVMQLLEDASQDGKAGFNPLDDYRTLFTFDLMIEREGKKPIPLSRRLGVGSNGEHRTPFYVIAGAAMTSAYRIESGKRSTGAGIMLLDEAFHGMDQQNALAVARFLDSIGLQMVMAAPEADHSKLAPTLDTIFEITRFDMDVYVEQTKIKEPAKTLLMSDMPSEHPDLLTEMIETLKAESE